MDFRFQEIQKLWNQQNIKMYKLLNFINKTSWGNIAICRDVENCRKLVGKFVSYSGEGESFWWPTLKHVNIMMFIDKVKLSDNIEVFFMPLMGISLYDFQYQVEHNGEEFPFHRKKAYTEDILWGLDYLHGKKLCLMNISENNIWICPERDIAVIGNFSCLMRNRSATMAKYSVTDLYQPPEVINSTPAEYFNGILAEMWSCGVMIIELFSGNALRKLKPVNFSIDETISKITHFVKTVTYDMLFIASPGPELAADSVMLFCNFIMKFIRVVPELRISANQAAMDEFLKDGLRLINFKHDKPPENASKLYRNNSLCRDMNYEIHQEAMIHDEVKKIDDEEKIELKFHDLSVGDKSPNTNYVKKSSEDKVIICKPILKAPCAFLPPVSPLPKPFYTYEEGNSPNTCKSIEAFNHLCMSEENQFNEIEEDSIINSYIGLNKNSELQENNRFFNRRKTVYYIKELQNLDDMNDEDAKQKYFFDFEKVESEVKHEYSEVEANHKSKSDPTTKFEIEENKQTDVINKHQTKVPITELAQLPKNNNKLPEVNSDQYIKPWIDDIVRKNIKYEKLKNQKNLREETQTSKNKIIGNISKVSQNMLALDQTVVDANTTQKNKTLIAEKLIQTQEVGTESIKKCQVLDNKKLHSNLVVPANCTHQAKSQIKKGKTLFHFKKKIGKKENLEKKQTKTIKKKKSEKILKNKKIPKRKLVKQKKFAISNIRFMQKMSAGEDTKPFLLSGEAGDTPLRTELSIVANKRKWYEWWFCISRNVSP